MYANHIHVCIFTVIFSTVEAPTLIKIKIKTTFMRQLLPPLFWRNWPSQTLLCPKRTGRSKRRDQNKTWNWGFHFKMPVWFDFQFTIGQSSRSWLQKTLSSVTAGLTASSVHVASSQLLLGYVCKDLLFPILKRQCMKHGSARTFVVVLCSQSCYPSLLKLSLELNVND